MGLACRPAARGRSASGSVERSSGVLLLGVHYGGCDRDCHL